eukprot:8690983-Pyramimonas_sp.AAC.1
MRGATPCWRCHWGLRWTSPGGNEARKGLAIGAVTHAHPAPGATGGALYGATKRARGVGELARSRMRALPLGPEVELLMGRQSGAVNARERGHRDPGRNSLWEGLFCHFRLYVH